MDRPEPAPEPTIASLFDLSGRVAVVTGATGHLGGAIARGLAEAGASLVVTSRDGARAVAFAATLPRVDDARHHGLALDQLDADALDGVFGEIVGHAGRVDVLVNNGHQAEGADWSTVTPDAFNRQLANATGYFVLARLVHGHARSRGAPASIINLASMYGMVASYPDAYDGICPASPVAYHALKGGILQMTRHLAAYWAADGVRVNSLSPGPFPGPKAPAGLVERLEGKLPMGRMGRPHELKGAALFLASDASAYMTGQNLVIDGGWTAW